MITRSLLAEPNPWRRRILLPTLFLLAALSAEINAWSGSRELIRNYQTRVKPALDFTRASILPCILINDQTIALELEAMIPQKIFVEPWSDRDFFKASLALSRAGQLQALMISSQIEIKQPKIAFPPGAPLAGAEFKFLRRLGDYYCYEVTFIPAEKNEG